MLARRVPPPNGTWPVQPGEEVPHVLERTGLPPITPAPDHRRATTTSDRVVLAGVTVIDGTGGPAYGPVDVGIEGGRIVTISATASSNGPLEGAQVMGLAGMWVMPGLVDAHAHLSLSWHGAFGTPPPAEYVQKLWLAHGITTVRDVGCMHGLGFAVRENERAVAGQIAAPRVVPHAYLPIDGGYFPATLFEPDETRRWVSAVAERGAMGLKILGGRPDLVRAALGEAGQLGLRTACHHAPVTVARHNVLDSARMGLTSMEHWYGLPEAMLDGTTVQDYPPEHNYLNEEHRFGEAGRLWSQTVEPGSRRWDDVRDELVSLDLTMVPTFAIYEANRDVMRARRADWQDEYTWPALSRFFQPNPDVHASHFARWTTSHEVAWRRNYQRWMAFVNDYKNHGGRVATGSDAGFCYQVYGFTLIRELEMLQEAGFHPLEVIRAATLKGAELVGLDRELGTVEVGKAADLVVLAENPLADFKVLYGTGALRYDHEIGTSGLRQLLRYTIKGGVVYEAEQLLSDVRDLVAEQQAKESAGAVLGG